MNHLKKITYFFSKPKYPVIVDLDGVLVAAKSARSLFGKLQRHELVEQQSYEAFDKTGESWSLMVVQSEAVLAPFNFTKRPTKLELIRWFNNRKNKPAGEADFPEKSFSNLKRDRILLEIADRLIEVDKRNRSRQD